MSLTTVLGGLSFPEGPRWRDGRLWFSDFYRHAVVSMSADGLDRVEAVVAHQPSGLGWLPDGRLLVVSMLDRRVLVLDGAASEVYADLSSIATGPCNDMVVAGDGNVYVGNFGFDRHAGESERTAHLARVAPDGAVSVAASGLRFPNGSVVTPDGATLIVAETRGHRLSAWDRAADGSLHGQRIWADLGEGYPDGICLDAAGAIWYADPAAHEVVRVLEGATVTDRISTGDRGAYACMLGGDDRRTLYVATNSGSGPDAASRRDGRIEATQVDVPGAGWP